MKEVRKRLTPEIALAVDRLREFSQEELLSFIAGEEAEEDYEGKSEWDEKDNSASYEYKGSKPITSFDEAVRYSGADMEVWEVERKVFNSWDVTMKGPDGLPIKKTNYQFKLWFRRKHKKEETSLFKVLLEDINSYVPPVFPPVNIVKSSGSKSAAIVNIFDAHLNKVSYLSETGTDSSIEQNEAVFETAFDGLLTSSIIHRPELIIFAVGNDLLNTNGALSATKKGTPQDSNIRSHDAFRIGHKLIRRQIDKAKQYGKVIIPGIAGNHDEDEVHHLIELLSVLYENDPDVEVMNGRQQRKYLQYGRNLFGFAHGDKEANKVNNLPLLMAEEEKHKWADTTYREWYLGDKHHKFEYKFMRHKDFPGVLVRFLRSVSCPDKWHHDQGYIGIPKTAESFIWDYDKGLKANYSVNI